MLLIFLFPSNRSNFVGITVRLFVTSHHQLHHNPEALVQITKITVISVTTVQYHYKDKTRPRLWVQHLRRHPA